VKEHWDVLQLGKLLNIQNGFAFDSKKFSSNGDMPLIRIRDLKNGSTTETSFSGEYDEKYVVSAGDYLIGMDGEFRCYEWKGNRALLNQRVCRLQNFSELLEARYLFYGINKFLKDIEDVTGFTTVKHLSGKQILDIPFPLPQIGEQKRIVALLDEAFTGLDAAIANTTKNLANARELFDSYVNSTFNGKEWPTLTLDALSENLDSKRVPITKSERIAGEVPYYGASGVVDHVEGHLFDEDLLLVSEDGANLLARTYPIAFSISGKTWVNNHAHVLRFPNICAQKFVEYYLNLISLAPYVSGMAQPKLNQKSLNSIPVPFPDFEIQAKVVEELDELIGTTRQLAANYQQKLDSLTELKQSLLHQAFTGQLTANAVSDDVAA